MMVEAFINDIIPTDSFKPWAIGLCILFYLCSYVLKNFTIRSAKIKLIEF